MGILVNNVNIKEEIKKIQSSIDDLKKKDISVKDISDGYHSFEELYHHRMILSSIVFNSNKDVAWKSLKHHDGTMFDDMFIVGVKTPEGQYSYHYKLEHWDLFDVKILENAPEYDGHKPSDIGRLLKLGR